MCHNASYIQYKIHFTHILISSSLSLSLMRARAHTHIHTEYLQLTAEQLQDFTEIKLKNNISSIQAKNFIL
jgi:hypothetical protein